MNTAVTLFAISREDGRSDAQVLTELIANAEPGSIFTYQQIIDALGLGSDREFDIASARGAVYRSLRTIGKETGRTLMNVRGVGYKIAMASDHRLIAYGRKERASVQLKKGLQVLQDVRWDEMDTQAKAAHQGTLLLMSALYANQQALEARQNHVEETLRGLVGSAEMRMAGA